MSKHETAITLMERVIAELERNLEDARRLLSALRETAALKRSLEERASMTALVLEGTPWPEVKRMYSLDKFPKTYQSATVGKSILEVAMDRSGQLAPETLIGPEQRRDEPSENPK
jgi:hypothetical protein